MTRRPRLVTIDVDELRRIVRGEVEAAVHSGPRLPVAWPAPPANASTAPIATTAPAATGSDGTSSSSEPTAADVWSDLRRRPPRTASAATPPRKRRTAP